MSSDVSSYFCTGGTVHRFAEDVRRQPQDANEHIAAGKVRPIAAITERRLRVLPDVPTVREQGIEMPIIANVRGILGPPDMPPGAAEYWADFFARLAKTVSWKKYVEENKFTFKVLLGGHGRNDSVSTAYAVSAHPTNYLVGPDGKILWRSVGFNEAEFRAALARAGIK